MNFTALETIVPMILTLLNDPNFQAILKAVNGDLTAAVAGGANPGAAAKKATGLLGAAAVLHLTGNPVADLQSLVSGLTSSSTSAKAM